MPYVMLRPNWPGNFRRRITERKAVEAKEGGKKIVAKELRLVEFSPNTPVEVSVRELSAIKANGDLGTALFEIEFDDKHRPRFLEPQTEETQAPVPSAE